MGDEEFALKLKQRVSELGLTLPESIEPKTKENTDDAEGEIRSSL